MNKSADKLLFQPDDAPSTNSLNTTSHSPIQPASKAPQAWKVMVIDDDRSTHDVTSLVLEDFSYEGRKLQILNGYSGEDVRRLMSEHPDTAVLLLDVVMETEHAGLDAVKYIREQLNNRFVRIILRTGQPGQAPEDEVITHYDINDYKDKSDLSSIKLNTAMVVALRSYQDLKKIQKLATSNDSLEQLVKERTVALAETNQQLKDEVQQRTDSEAQLAEAQRLARIGSWVWDTNSGEMTWSDQIYRILGLDISTDEANYPSFLNSIHPDERITVEETHKKTIENKAPFFNVEHRIVKPDGTQLYVCQQGEIGLDSKGQILGITGTLQDITERRIAEESMRKLSLAVEQTADSILITDSVGVIEYVNPAFEETTGYSKKEILGKNPNILKSNGQNEVFYKRMWNTILAGEVFSDVVINKRKDGSLYYEEKTITPQKNPQGVITHFISSGKDISERMESQQKLQHLAHHDSLTGLPNRILFQDRLHQAIPRMGWHKRHIGILFIDLDRFKRINDTLGHDIGDLLLCDAAERFSQCIREGDTVARLGGDEFAIILNDLASKDDIPPVADKIIRSLSQPFLINNNELFISASIGIAMFPEDGRDNKALLKKADIAMYHAKANNGGTYFFYADEGNVDAAERLALESKLTRALDRGEFYLNYQPQLHLASSKIISREVLLRWSHPQFTNISPAEFIPLLEETGLIVPVGEWVLRTACLDEMIRQNAGLPAQRIAVNLSIRQFCQSDFVRIVESIIDETGIDPKYVELEVTEGLLINNVTETAKILHQLHDLGVKLSIDDFGTGYSSMNYLKRLPFDTLKIDQSFVHDITTNSDDAAIASAIITLAHSMELEVVAEGVETLDQLDFLHKQGCDIIQGYLCCRPIPFSEINSFEEIPDNVKHYLNKNISEN